MTRAAILVVDDHPEELARLGRELGKRYGQDYQVLQASSGHEALEVLRPPCPGSSQPGTSAVAR